jgi:hypothetical protein
MENSGGSSFRADLLLRYRHEKDAVGKGTLRSLSRIECLLYLLGFGVWCRMLEAIGRCDEAWLFMFVHYELYYGILFFNALFFSLPLSCYALIILL